MARDESRAIGGYYPLPIRLIPHVASLIDFQMPRGGVGRAGDPFVLFDPCAGDGGAIIDLKGCWFPRCWTSVLCCEMEKTRGEQLRSNIAKIQGRAIVADAFRLSWSKEEHGASVLFLNPPYDTDSEHGRLEHRWLTRFTPALAPGGVLIYVVPDRALKASAEFIARNFIQVKCWRFPFPEFEDFRQVVLVGRRLKVPGNPETATAIGSWAHAGALPSLPEKCETPLRIAARSYSLTLAEVEFDLAEAIQCARIWEGEPLGVDMSLGDLIGRQYPTALPPKPAHLALALAAGHFNGHRLRPNRGLGPGWPAVLIKGVFCRELVEIERVRNKQGEETGSIQVETPRLRMSGLRLDRLEFFEPLPGSEPSDAGSLDEANTADILVAYSEAFADLMASQFPPLHDPSDPAQEIRLPDLARPPMTVQRHGIMAALKLMADGRNPKFVAEVGVGKTMMTTCIAAALSPRHHAETQASLRSLGGRFAGARLPRVRRSLVLCPPHLLDSWVNETAKFWPGARVVIVRELADLDRESEVYVLGRETAKLGYGIRGLAGRCPRCGGPTRPNAEQNAKRRQRCENRVLKPLNLWAALAEELAPIVLGINPGSELAHALTRHRPILAKRADRKPGKLDRGGALRTAKRCAAELGRLLLDSDACDNAALATASTALVPLALAAGGREEIMADLAVIIAQKPKAAGYAYGRYEHWTPFSYAEDAFRLLKEASSNPGEEWARENLGTALSAFADAGEWTPKESVKPCGEPHWQAIPSPRRYPIAQYIMRHRRGRFDLLVLDEVHEFCNQGTAQQKAAHRLAEMGIPVLALSGSVMGGYSSSLFPNWWALDREFRGSFGRDEASAFVARYGFQKYLLTPRQTKNKNGDVTYGSVTDRESANVQVLGEVPGVLSLFLLRHLLPAGVVIHKADLDVDLPPVTERPAPLGAAEDMDVELLQEYRRLESALLSAIASDVFTPLQGKLWGQLSELPSYLDRATADQGTYEIRYPEDVGGMLVATARPFPKEYVTPKERWLLDRLGQERAAGRRTMVFCRHTGGEARLPRRLQRLIAEKVGAKTVFLEVSRVPAPKREKWIDANVIAPGVEVLLVNPNAVRTGLNNLVAFSTAVWYEADYDARTYRQANGRLHRIGQTLPVEIWFPFYANTIQAVAQDLIARKVTASLQVDGLSVTGALEAAGAGEDARAAIELAMRMGEAIYRRLSRGGRVQSA